MKRVLPYLLSVLVVTLVASTINISFNREKSADQYTIIAPSSPRDSFMKQEQIRRQQLLDDGNGIEFFSFGTRQSNNTGQHYLLLGEYYRQPGVSFDIQNGNTIYRYPANPTTHGVEFAGFKEKIIPVRYAYDPFMEESSKGAVLIPISKGSYGILQIFTSVLFIAALVLILYFGFYKFIRVLLDIAKGRGFTQQNTARLYLVGWTFILIPFIPLLLLQIGDWYFAESIPEGVSFSFLHSLRGYWVSLLIGSIILVTALAFEKGIRLKKEMERVL